MPNEPEVIGLHALLCFSIARINASIVKDKYIPLEDQDHNLWDSALFDRGRWFIVQASKKGSIGRFQLEASIQGLHCDSDNDSDTKWSAIAQLHEALMVIRPSLGVAVSRAAAIAKSIDAEAGLTALAQINADDVAGFQPFWATKAHPLAESGSTDKETVIGAYEKAISLSDSEVVRDWLRGRCLEITSPC